MISKDPGCNSTRRRSCALPGVKTCVFFSEKKIAKVNEMAYYGSLVIACLVNYNGILWNFSDSLVNYNGILWNFSDYSLVNYQRILQYGIEVIV